MVSEIELVFEITTRNFFFKIFLLIKKNTYCIGRSKFWVGTALSFSNNLEGSPSISFLKSRLYMQGLKWVEQIVAFLLFMVLRSLSRSALWHASIQYLQISGFLFGNLWNPMVLVRFFTGQLATAHVLLFLEYESELESLATSLRLKRW